MIPQNKNKNNNNFQGVQLTIFFSTVDKILLTVGFNSWLEEYLAA